MITLIQSVDKTTNLDNIRRNFESLEYDLALGLKYIFITKSPQSQRELKNQLDEWGVEYGILYRPTLNAIKEAVGSKKNDFVFILNPNYILSAQMLTKMNSAYLNHPYTGCMKLSAEGLNGTLTRANIFVEYCEDLEDDSFIKTLEEKGYHNIIREDIKLKRRDK